MIVPRVAVREMALSYLAARRGLSPANRTGLSPVKLHAYQAGIPDLRRNVYTYAVLVAEMSRLQHLGPARR